MVSSSPHSWVQLHNIAHAANVINNFSIITKYNIKVDLFFRKD